MQIKNINYALAASFFCFLIIVPNQAIAEQTPYGNVNQQYTTSSLEHLSAEEKKWFAKFQKGTFYAQGWKGITADIIKKTPEELRPEQQIALESLGFKIGCEWSKSNKIRKIDNDMLRQWGDQLKKTAGEDPYQIPKVIAELDQLVVMMLD